MIFSSFPDDFRHSDDDAPKGLDPSDRVFDCLRSSRPNCRDDRARRYVDPTFGSIFDNRDSSERCCQSGFVAEDDDEEKEEEEE